MFLAGFISISTIIVTAFIYRSITVGFQNKLIELKQTEKQAEEKYIFAKKRIAKLKKQIQQLEMQETLLAYTDEAPSNDIAKQYRKEAEKGLDPTSIVSDYMLKNAIISLEQSEKAMRKMPTLQMDFLGVCLALGFIDVTTAKTVAIATKTAASA